MPQTDPGYLTGVIREREKTLLGDEAYTRILGATSAEEAVRSLADTPYGAHLSAATTYQDVVAALTAEAKDEFAWILDGLNNKTVALFMTARYDALNIAHSLVSYANKEDAPHDLSPLGSLSQDLLFSAIWKGEDIAGIPKVWRNAIAQERLLVGESSWSVSALLDRMTNYTLEVFRATARTPLSRELTAVFEARATTDRYTRQIPSLSENMGMIGDLIVTDATTPQEVITALHHVGVASMTLEVLEDVRSRAGALVYERVFDEAIVHALRAYRLDVVGYDPVLAYWFGREMERKTLRMVLSAKFSGVTDEVMRALIRPLYHHSFV